MMQLTGNVQGMIDLMGGGSNVEVTQVLTSGEKIAIISVDNVPTNIYAPDGGSDVKVTQVVSSGTKIATITVDDTPTDIYAPSNNGHVWSNNEHIIGTWIDGVTPVYERTFTGLDITCSSNVWANTGIITSDIRFIEDAQALLYNSAACFCCPIGTSGGNIVIVNLRSADIRVEGFTCRYIKTA